MLLAVDPIAKPRMTQADRWKRRPCVMRYRDYCDYLRLSGVKLTESAHLMFWLPMPPSWSKRKRAAMDLQPHKQRPDLDNLIKAVLDALAPEDSYVARIHASKWWAVRGAVWISELEAGAAYVEVFADDGPINRGLRIPKRDQRQPRWIL